MQVQRFFAEEQVKLRARMETMQEAEQRKQAAILATQQQKRVEMREKRAIVELRIEKNIEMAEAVERKRTDDFIEKQMTSEDLRRRQEETIFHERELHAQELELQEQRRKMILLQKRKEEEREKAKMLIKFEEEEQHVEEVLELTKREQELLKERRKLHVQMKADNVERVKRMSEYKRIGVLKKIEKNDERTSAMLTQRELLIKQRKETSIKSKLQRDNINKLMEEVRTDASKANKVMALALKGKVSMDSLTSAVSSPGSAHKKPKSRDGNRLKNNRSAGDAMFPKDMAGNTKYSNLDDGLENPKPYISPYETYNDGSPKKVSL